MNPSHGCTGPNFVASCARQLSTKLPMASSIRLLKLFPNEPT